MHAHPTIYVPSGQTAGIHSAARALDGERLTPPPFRRAGERTNQCASPRLGLTRSQAANPPLAGSFLLERNVRQSSRHCSARWAS
ncbi:hypothetical protein VTK26DRAFT_1653 [Humicola hyalothermophila]